MDIGSGEHVVRLDPIWLIGAGIYKRSVTIEGTVRVGLSEAHLENAE